MASSRSGSGAPGPGRWGDNTPIRADCRAGTAYWSAFPRNLQGVGFGRHGQGHHRLGQVDIALRHADKVAGLIGRHRQLQGPRVRQAHVLRRQSARRAARCRAGPPRPPASARASRPRRPDRNCAWTCAGRRSGCSAPRRSCHRAGIFCWCTAPGFPRVTVTPAPSMSPFSTAISRVPSAVRASPLAKRRDQVDASRRRWPPAVRRSPLGSFMRMAQQRQQILLRQRPAARTPCSGTGARC